jgi:carbamate kinase
VRIVIALGGNALLRRGEPMTAEVQRRNVRVAAEAIGPLTPDHQIVIAHGNGPQVGLLALESEAYADVDPYPLDVLGAETEGMIGYMIEQELTNVVSPDVRLATLLTMVEVDPADPAFADPTKFVGPVYSRDQAEKLADEKGWTYKPDGDRWRRVVPSPRPRRIVEIDPIRWLLERGALVVCAGGGGIPVTVDGNGKLTGVEAVIDKDFASELLAEMVDADLFVMATDVDGAYVGWGQPDQRRLDRVTPDELGAFSFPGGSMGPKVDAAVKFARSAGRRASIGGLADIARIVDGTAGTNVSMTGG